VFASVLKVGAGEKTPTVRTVVWRTGHFSMNCPDILTYWFAMKVGADLQWQGLSIIILCIYMMFFVCSENLKLRHISCNSLA